MKLESLIKSILTLGSAELATEEAAIDAIIRRRWPSGTVFCPRCSCACERDGVRLRCPLRRCRFSFTIFINTCLETLRRPRARSILLGLRAMAASKRGISAMELGKETGVPHTTMWRHLHRLREMIPLSGVEPSTKSGASIRVCGRGIDLDDWVQGGGFGEVWPASVTAYPRRFGKMCVTASASWDDRGGRYGRLALENFRTWLNGTFHGVWASYLPLYVLEYDARASFEPSVLLLNVLLTLFRL